jgi:hypothetical protein
MQYVQRPQTERENRKRTSGEAALDDGSKGVSPVKLLPAPEAAPDSSVARALVLSGDAGKGFEKREGTPPPPPVYVAPRDKKHRKGGTPRKNAEEAASIGEDRRAQ